MLRNTGSYGPNDRVVNMENGQNMPQVNGAMDMLHNISNPTKTPQQAPQPANSRYNLPEYTSFAHNPYNMRPGFVPFPNYNFGGFPSNYNPHIFQDNSINNVNGMLPMNPNSSLGHSANFMDYTAFSKRPNEYQAPSSYIHQGMYDKNYPINIPHVPSKMFDKPYADRSQHNFMPSQEFKTHYSEIGAIKDQNLAYNQQHFTNSLMPTIDNKRSMERSQMIPTPDHSLQHEHILTSNLNLDLSNRPVHQNLDLSNRPATQNLDLSNQPVSQNLDLSNRTIDQNLDLSNRLINQNLDLSNRTITQNLGLSNQPNTHNLDLSNRPVDQNLDLPSRPIDQNLDLSSRPIAQNLDLSNQQVHTITSNTMSKENIEKASTIQDTPAISFTKTVQQEIKSAEVFQRTFDKPAIETIDSTRRKNIENTVRFIEDILMKSCPQSNRHDPNVDANLELEEPKLDIKQAIENISEQSLDNDDNDVHIKDNVETPKPKDNSNEIKSEEPSSVTHHDDVNAKLSENTIQTSDNTEQSDDSVNKHDNKNYGDSSTHANQAVFFKTITINDKQTEESKSESKDEEDFEEESDDVADSNASVKVKQEPMEIEVKLEYISSWTDVDYCNPFNRDSNGVQREDVLESAIIESEKSLEEAVNIVKHNLTSKPDTHFECSNCSLIFKNAKRYLIHVKWHTFGLTNEKRLEIQRAKEMRKQQRRVVKREERLKSEMEEGEDFACKDCGQVFNSKNTLKNHRSRKHPTKVRTCTICSKEVLGFRQLKAHMMTHQNDTSYQCDQCPKKFKFPQSLAKHAGIHMEKTHPCNQCDKKFGSDNLLKTHMLCHKRAQRGPIFGCSYCGKGFYEMYSLQAHERTHRNEKPFTCHLCNAGYGTNSSLKRHMKVAHEGGQRNDEGSFTCHLCNTTYTANSSLKRHLKRSHENEAKPFTCPTCQRCFINAIILERHEKRAHGSDEDFKFHCTECSTKYIHQRDYKKHMWKVHSIENKRKRHSESEYEPND